MLIEKLKWKFSPSALPLESGDYTIPFFFLVILRGPACLPAGSDSSQADYNLTESWHYKC